MKIAICTEAGDSTEWVELAGTLHRFMEDIEILTCQFDDIFRDSPPRGVDAAFVCVDNMRALEGARKLHLLGIPMIVLSDSPDYAMEGIRLEVRHYIIRPVTEPEIRAALRRLGIPV